MTTGQRIKLARRNAGLTQKELGQKLGITYQTLAQWENDLRKPKFDTLKRIADALGVPVGELLGLEDMGGGLWGHEADDSTVMKLAQNIKAHMTPKAKLNAAFDQLNNEGQGVAVQRVEELTEIPRYRKDAPDDQTPQGEG